MMVNATEATLGGNLLPLSLMVSFERVGGGDGEPSLVLPSHYLCDPAKNPILVYQVVFSCCAVGAPTTTTVKLRTASKT